MKRKKHVISGAYIMLATEKVKLKYINPKFQFLSEENIYC